MQARHSGYFGLVLSETHGRRQPVAATTASRTSSLPAGRVRVNSRLRGRRQRRAEPDLRRQPGAQLRLALGERHASRTASPGSTTRTSTASSSPPSCSTAGARRTSPPTCSAPSPSTRWRTWRRGARRRSAARSPRASAPPAQLDRRARHRRLVPAHAGPADPVRPARGREPLHHHARLQPAGGATSSGGATTACPTPVSVSPRVGFSWTVGKAPEIASFAGAARAPRAVVRGGIGVFTNGGERRAARPGARQHRAAAWARSRSCASAPRRRSRTGATYADDPRGGPRPLRRRQHRHRRSPTRRPTSRCSPPDFRPQRSVRSNLSWNGSVLDGRFSLNVEGTYSLNLNQQRSVDLNFDPTARFTLDAEGRPGVRGARPASSRPPASIASRDARVSQAFARVTELRSDLRVAHGAAQPCASRPMHARARPRSAGARRTRTRTCASRCRASRSTAGNPLDVEWARSGQGPHQINYSLRYNFFDAVQVSWNGSFRSGSAFTPTVAGDVNGDGYSQRPRLRLPARRRRPTRSWRRGCASCSPTRPTRTRECLEAQLGTIAARNSCRGPWSSERVAQRHARPGEVPHAAARARSRFSLSNPLGAADLLVNGSGNLGAGGRAPSPDQSLLYVRGFDPATQRYRYEVNQRFGATRPQFLTLRAPVTLTMSMRFDLGPTRERQSLAQQLGMGRTQPGSRMPGAVLPLRREQRRPEPDGGDPAPAGLAAAHRRAGGQHRLDEPPLHVPRGLALDAGRPVLRGAPGGVRRARRVRALPAPRAARRSTC